MRIDPKVEEPLRRAYVAVVDEDFDSIQSPLEVLDEEQSRACLAYAVYVVGYVTNDVHPNPDADAAAVMAERLVPEVSEWSGLDDQAQATAFLLACAVGDPEFTGVARDNIAAYALIIGGTQLSRYRPDGMRWFEYLDQIWNHAESLSGQA